VSCRDGEALEGPGSALQRWFPLHHLLAVPRQATDKTRHMAVKKHCPSSYYPHFSLSDTSQCADETLRPPCTILVPWQALPLWLCAVPPTARCVRALRCRTCRLAVGSSGDEALHLTTFDIACDLRDALGHVRLYNVQQYITRVIRVCFLRIFWQLQRVSPSMSCLTPSIRQVSQCNHMSRQHSEYSGELSDLQSTTFCQQRSV
jgi:hypothetical protein